MHIENGNTIFSRKENETWLIKQVQYKNCNPDCGARDNDRVGADMKCPFIFALVIIDQSRRGDQPSTRLLCHTNIFLIFSI